jgi:hypothetical protein
MANFIRHYNQKRLGLVIPGRCGIRGEFRLVNRDYKGRLKFDSGWFDNLITNQGLENMGKKGESASVWAAAIAIGSGTTPPSFSDTAMETPIQGAGFYSSSSYGDFVETYGWSAPIPWMATQNYGRFGSGYSGTVNEVGLGSETQPQNNFSLSPWLSVRQLLPTPFVKQTTDVLDVYYRAYWYFDTTDATGQVTLDGTLYDYVVRLGGLAGSNQGYNWGTCFYTPDLQRTEGGNISDGELTQTNQSESALDDLGANVTGNYVTVTQGAICGVGEKWNEILVNVGLDTTLVSEVMRVIHTHSWTGRICTQVRLGRNSDDAPVPFTDKDIMSARHRLYFDRFTPDLFASPGAFAVAGDDAALTFVP